MGAARLISLVALLLIALAGSPAGAFAEPGGPAVVDVEGTVGLRAEPGSWSWAVAEAAGGEWLVLLAGPTADGWYQVQRGDQIGWVHGWYLIIDGALGWGPPAELGPAPPPDSAPLDPSTAAEIGVGGPTDSGMAADAAAETGSGNGLATPTETEPGVDPGTAWVVGEGSNLYAAPDLGADVLGVATSGEPVTVTGDALNGFVPVSSWLGAGWVWGDLLAYGPAPLAVGGPTMPAEPAPGLASGPVPATDPGVVPPAAPAWPEPVPVAPTERWVDVNRSTQTVTLYEGGVPVAGFWGAMGREQSADGFFATAVGTYYVYEKYRDLSWTVWGNAWIRDWVGFDASRVNGFHSYSMDWTGTVLPDGAGPTNGCIALDSGASSTLFDFVTIGTRVEVHW